MTSLLLDTHTMLWFFWDDRLLSARAKSLDRRGEQSEVGQRRKLLGNRHQGRAG